MQPRSSGGRRESNTNIGRKRIQEDGTEIMAAILPPGDIPLVLPYVNEENAKDVNRIVRRANPPIKLVFKSPPN
ncbi:hypothetical protein Y032_0091g2410 [Ancylostoma ceylanicum]|uniref:Uncharacterized protein n=1 Tax=Ancylostoma ceylanicum TaxID=53326 RepID=A0A016TM27_9BILA|nr:hypothetical protein Y032_0091g2410 [Ancylostoma ceylanicum]